MDSKNNRRGWPKGRKPVGVLVTQILLFKWELQEMGKRLNWQIHYEYRNGWSL